jgi:hypothetical protein
MEPNNNKATTSQRDNVAELGDFHPWSWVKRPHGIMQQIVRSWVQYNLVCGNLGFPLHKETWGFHFGRIWLPLVDTKLGVSNRIGCSEGINLGRDLEIANFGDVSRDDNDLR